MRSIREYGLESSTSAARTPKRFIEDTAEILRELRSKYPGHAKGKAFELVERWKEESKI